MKRKIFLLAVAVAALASCSSDETLSVNQGLEDANTIGFRPLVSGMTRANAKASFVSTDVIDVWAVYNNAKYFQDDFTHDGSTFASTTKHFWPSNIGTTFAS